MFQVFVLPTMEDQLAFANGDQPTHVFSHSFETEGELEAYVEGVESMADEASYDVIDESESSITLNFNGDSESDDEDDDDSGDIRSRGQEFEYKTQEEKEAFKLGLDDGEGYSRPEIYTEETDGFEELKRMAV